MKAMTYEILLRRIYNCDRGGVPGADASVFRKMEHAYNRYKKEADGNLNSDFYYDLNIETIRVANFILAAITKFAIEYDDKIIYENQKELALVKASLLVPTYDIVCKAVNTFSNILREMNITL